MEATGMTRIAHLSDSHMLDPRPSRTRSGWSMRVRFLSFGRPLDVAFHQPVTRSAGYINANSIEALEARASDPAHSHKPLVVVQHHPPFERKTKAWDWIDGLIGAKRMMGLLEAFRHLFVLHGHLHYVVDRALGCGVNRIFGATSVVDDKDAPRVRVYDVADGLLAPANASAHPT